MRIDGPQISGSFILNGEGVQDLDVFATTSSLNTFTSSVDTTMGHVMTTTHSLNTFTSSVDSRMISIESKTGSYATTGSNIFIGTQTISGSIIPSVDNTYDLGSTTHQFRDLYLSSASLYIDGTKVLSSTTQELQITTDNGQSFKILEAGSDTITLQSNDGNITFATSGGGDVILDPTTGIIALKGTTTLYAGNKILSSDGNAIQIGNSVTMTGSLIVTGFIEAQELRTTYISSSILYRSGSTKFGDELTDTHAFTGSLLVSGSISVPGSGLISGSSQILNGSGVFSGSAQVDVMSTTNIARLATTGSNTFSGIQTFSTTTTENAIFNSPLNGGYITLKENNTIGGYLQWGLTLNGNTGGNYMLITSAESGGNIALQTRTTGGTYNDSALVINSTGNVGISTTTPLEKLSVTGNIHVAGVGNNLYFDTDGSGRAISQYVSNLYEFNIVNGRGNSSRFILGNGSISLGTSGTAMFHINTTTGNIGIGGNSAGSKLDVNGNIYANGDIRSQGIFRDYQGEALIQTNTSAVTIIGSSGASTSRSLSFFAGNSQSMVITTSGQVGIGTGSPARQFVVSNGGANGLEITPISSGTIMEVISYNRSTAAYTPLQFQASGFKFTGNNTSSTPLIDLVASGTGTFQRGVRLLNNGMNSGDHIMYAVGRADGTRNMGQTYFYYSGDGSTSNRLSFGLHSVDDVMHVQGNGTVSIATTDQNGSSRLYVGGAIRAGRTIYNWYQNGTNDWDGKAFLHLKTNMSSGASGNVDHTMSLFYGRLYSYSSAYIREGHYGFHNWSGTMYNPVTTGNFWSGGYSSSDGFVVLVVALGSGSYFGVTIDWHQSYPYTFRDRSVTAVSSSNSSSGVY